MKRLVVQIYEIQTPREAEMMVDAGVDHIGGVILSEKEWKQPTLKEAVDITASSDSLSSIIPLFSDPESIYRVIDWYRPDIIHFCEALSGVNGLLPVCSRLVENQAEIKNRYPEVKIMRSVPIAKVGYASKVPTLEIAELFESVSDYFLTDTLLFNDMGDDKEQPVDGFVGITGITCDWDMAGKLIRQSSIPVILAGGLSPDNVYDGTVSLSPSGVDSCTQTNMKDNKGNSIRFKKDIERVKRFVEEARRAELKIREVKRLSV